MENCAGASEYYSSASDLLPHAFLLLKRSHYNKLFSQPSWASPFVFMVSTGMYLSVLCFYCFLLFWRSLVAATHSVVMDTVLIWFSLFSGFTILSGTIPELINQQLGLTSSSNMSSIICSDCSPFSIIFPLKTMLLNCSAISSLCLTDINDIFVILILCGIWAEIDKNRCNLG